MRSSNAIGTARAFCSAGCDASPSAKSLRSADGEVIAIEAFFFFSAFFQNPELPGMAGRGDSKH